MVKSFNGNYNLSLKAGSSSGSLRPETEWELRPEQPVAQRCKYLKDLSDLHLQTLNLEETAIVKLWDTTKDLLVPTKSTECRQTALTFYKRLIYTQYKNLTYMREQFFLVIQNHEVPEDLKHRLELLDTLTENGKDIKNLEEKVSYDEDCKNIQTILLYCIHSLVYFRLVALCYSGYRPYIKPIFYDPTWICWAI